MSTPADYAGCIFWLQTAYNQHMWDGTIGGSTNPVPVDGQVRNLSEQVAGKTLTAPSDATRPYLRSDATRLGSLEFSTTNRSLQIGSSASTFNTFHVGGVGTIIFWIKFVNATSSGSLIVFSSNTSTGSKKGITLLRDVNEQLRFLVTSGSGAILDITTTATIADTNWHKVKIVCQSGSNASSITIDNGTPRTGTRGTVTSGDAFGNLWLGIRDDSNNPAICSLSDLVILNQVIAGADETHFDSWNPPIGGPVASTKKRRVILW